MAGALIARGGKDALTLWTLVDHEASQTEPDKIPVRFCVPSQACFLRGFGTVEFP